MRTGTKNILNSLKRTPFSKKKTLSTGYVKNVGICTKELNLQKNALHVTILDHISVQNAYAKSDMMTELKQIYKCDICGNIVEVLHTGKGELVCCGKPMVLKKPDDGPEDYSGKHAPVIEKTENGIKVKVGAIAHPMGEDHYIEWIEVIVDGKYSRKFLTPNDKPEAEFCMTGEEIKARMYCNIHGLWRSK